MKIIGWHLIRLLNETASDLAGMVVETIGIDRESGRLMIGFEARRHRTWLVIGCRGTQQAFFWVTEKSEVPSVDAFATTEKFNRLKGSRLEQATMPGPDRIVRFKFEKLGPLPNEARRLDLWVTWTGAAGNVSLVEPAGMSILETLWPIQSIQSTTIFSVPVPPPLLNWQTLTFPEYEGERLACPHQKLGEFLQEEFWGIDAAIAQLVEQKADQFTQEQYSSWAEFECVLHILRRAVDPSTPVIVQTEHGKSDVILPLTEREGKAATAQFATLASALAMLDQQSAQDVDRTALLARLQTTLRDRLRRLQHRIAETERAIVAGPKAAELRKNADLLNAQRGGLRPGMSQISIMDFETNTTITIELDPAKHPQQNINALYRTASKIARAANNAAAALPALVGEQKVMEARLRSLENPEVHQDEIDAIGLELRAVTPKARPGKPAKQKRLPYREFRLGSHLVLVGRSSRDNDQLTLKIARPHDLFLHASQSGGAHVILRRESKDKAPDHKAILAAAQVAAHFSKAKHSHLVPVIYTEVRHVRKPRKAPPGLVQVTKEKSVMVRPLPPPGYHDSGIMNDLE